MFRGACLSLFLLGAACVPLVGCNEKAAEERTVSVQLESALSKKSLSLIEQAQKGEVFKVVKNLNGNVEYIEAKPLSETQLKHLKALVLDDKNYLFGFRKRCPFIPETGFSLSGPQGQITLLLSHSCKQIRFVEAFRGKTLDIDPSVEKFKRI